MPAPSHADPRVLNRLLKPVTLLHRWLGVALCLMLALWFLTGSVISFVPFPSLGQQQRLASSGPIPLLAVQVAPDDALAAAGLGEFVQLRLTTVNREPRYLVTGADGRVAALSAVTGQRLPPLDATAAAAVAAQFAAHPVARVLGPLQYDQWTIHDKYRPLRPFFRASLTDASATTLYVSAVTGQVVQRTTRRERIWNRLGAVIHWINVPALRVNQPLWHALMWGVALAAIALIVAGLLMGYGRLWQHRRAHRPGLSPYRGALRWHHALGLFTGVIALSWAGSGWLSLDQGTWFPSDQPTRAQLSRFGGLSARELAATWPVSVIRNLPAARELEWHAVGGTPLLVLYPDEQPGESLLIRGSADFDSARHTLPHAQIRDAVERGWAPARALGTDAIAADDPYQLRNYPLPSSAVRVMLDDAAGTWVQVDAATGAILSVLNDRRRVYRWLVDGLHQFDFPWLKGIGPWWHALLLLATGIGFVFSSIGVVLAWRRVRRKLFG